MSILASHSNVHALVKVVTVVDLHNYSLEGAMKLKFAAFCRNFFRTPKNLTMGIIHGFRHGNDFIGKGISIGAE